MTLIAFYSTLLTRNTSTCCNVKIVCVEIFEAGGATAQGRHCYTL